MTNKNQMHHGAVSLFIVIFTTLLMTVITVSFVRIMLQDQREATATDLSQSAYDSAQAGVEDGKRALLRYLSLCNNGDALCQQAKDSFYPNSNTCNAAVLKLTDVSSNYNASTGDVAVKTGSNASLEQAYTCVKIALNTNDYLGTFASQDESKVIPLNGVSSFDTVQIEWFNNKNTDSTGNLNLISPSSSSILPGYTLPLRQTTAWPTNRPPVMRAQFMQFGSQFTLGDFDAGSSSTSDNNTVFIYPIGQSGSTATPTNSPINITGYDSRSNSYNGKTLPVSYVASTIQSNQPVPIVCMGSLSGGANFACMAQIKLPNPIIHVAGDSARNLFLRLTALYNASNYRITLLQGAQPVQFNAVQPEIDSTGRANTLYRRVSTRVELSDVDFPYPEAEIDIDGSFCKNFSITDDVGDYNQIDVFVSASGEQLGSSGCSK